MAMLSEVARTGRKFRRLKEPQRWFWVENTEIVTHVRRAIDNMNVPTRVNFSTEEIIATDWESEPKRLEVTAQDLLEAAKLVSNEPIVHQRRFSPVEMMKMVIPLLGLD